MLQIKNLIIIILLFQFPIYAQMLVDFDGNAYPVIQISNQLWMGENLKVTHFNNGDSISLVKDSTAWSKQSNAAMCYFNNDSFYYKSYGALYNYYSVEDVRSLCPIGWHIPSQVDWDQLSDYYGGDSVSGCKLKEMGTLHWDSVNTCATNESNFSALPGGSRTEFGEFQAIHGHGFWWSSNSKDSLFAYSKVLNHGKPSFDTKKYQKNNAFSIRCIKDGYISNKNENSEISIIKIYPNPASDFLYIETGRKENIYTYILFDAYGNTVDKNKLYDKLNTIKIDFLSKGYYVLIIYDVQSVNYYSFIKK